MTLSSHQEASIVRKCQKALVSQLSNVHRQNPQASCNLALLYRRYHTI